GPPNGPGMRVHGLIPGNLLSASAFGLSHHDPPVRKGKSAIRIRAIPAGMLLWAYLAHLLDSNGVRALSEPQHSNRPSARRHETYRQQQIKFWEPFRPFAPVILEGRADDFFQGLGDRVPNYPVRYWLLWMLWDDD